jgi:hypothetical protein
MLIHPLHGDWWTYTSTDWDPGNGPRDKISKPNKAKRGNSENSKVSPNPEAVFGF